MLDNAKRPKIGACDRKAIIFTDQSCCYFAGFMQAIEDDINGGLHMFEKAGEGCCHGFSVADFVL